jgi:hypothetical protein
MRRSKSRRVSEFTECTETSSFSRALIRALLWHISSLVANKQKPTLSTETSPEKAHGLCELHRRYDWVIALSTFNREDSALFSATILPDRTFCNRGMTIEETTLNRTEKPS